MYKYFKILPNDYKKKSVEFISFLFIASFFEILSIGLILPLLQLVFNETNNSNIFSLIINNLAENNSKQQIFYGLTFILFFLYLFKSIYLLYFNYWQLKFSQNVYKFLSCELLNTYFRYPITFFYKKNSSELIRNVYTECKIYGNFISLILKLVVEFSLIFFIILLLIYIDTFKTLIIIIISSLLFIIYYNLTKTKIYRFGITRVNSGGEQIKVLNESFGGIRDIKLKAAENFFLKLYEKAVKNFTSAAYKQQWIIDAPRYIFEFLFVSIILFALLILIKNNYSFNTLLPILSLYIISGFRVIPSLMRITNILQQIKGMKHSINLLQHELETQYLELNQNEKNNQIIFKNKISLLNVNFAYEGKKPVFNNFHLTIKKKNSCIGIMGKSGSGKSTLIDLITGLIKPNSGKVLVDDLNIEENLYSWQKKIGYVSQSIFLLDGSIKENVAFASLTQDIDEKKIIDCLHQANLKDYVEALTDGINTVIGEKGAKLSGGQKQRILIARELYRNPEVLILDEATSALDEDTENLFLEFLKNLKNKITIIIVSYRKSTLKSCDMIMEIND